MASDSSMKINLTPRAQKILREFQEQTGMTQKAITERLFDWFVKQDPLLQVDIANWLPDSQKVVLRAWTAETLSALSKRDEKLLLVDDAVEDAIDTSQAAQRAGQEKRRQKRPGKGRKSTT